MMVFKFLSSSQEPTAVSHPLCGWGGSLGCAERQLAFRVLAQGRKPLTSTPGLPPGEPLAEAGGGSAKVAETLAGRQGSVLSSSPGAAGARRGTSFLGKAPGHWQAAFKGANHQREADDISESQYCFNNYIPLKSSDF